MLIEDHRETCAKMQYKTWKAIDVALTELENRVGLPDFPDLASEIGKALRTPPTHVADSIEIRKTRLQKAKKDHALEMKSIKFKSASIAAELTPTAIKDAKEKCKALTEAVRLALVERDIASADAALDSLILDFPHDESVAELCEDVERAATCLRREQETRKADLLKPVADLSAIASSDGTPRVVVTWSQDGSGLATEYRVVRQNLLTMKASSAYLCERSPYVDEDVKLGIPYCYTVVPCYHGLLAQDAAMATPAVVATIPLISLQVYGEGSKNCAAAYVSWKLPAYDPAVILLLQLVRIHGCTRKNIEVANCVDQIIDEDVKVGETYRYELILEVSGKKLEPIGCDVIIQELPDLPVIEAFCYYQEGRYWLRVEWPDGVSEIRLISSEGRSVQYTKEDYDKRRVAIPHTFSESQLEVQAIRRFGDDKLACGPKSQVVFSDARSILYVSIERAHRGPLSFLKPWQKDIWGIRFDFDGNSFPQEVRVSIEDGGATQTFTIEGDRIRKGEFMPFPLRWGVRSGVNIDVQPSDCSYVKFLTSQMIP